MTDELRSQLSALHTRAIDARNGYDEALRDAEGKGLTGLFQEMITLHSANAEQLAAALLRLGEHPDSDGSFMSTIHRTIMSVRSLFGGLDESVVPGLVDGEKRNLESYDAALQQVNLTDDIRRLLQEQRDRLSAAVASMKSIHGC